MALSSPAPAGSCGINQAAAWTPGLEYSIGSGVQPSQVAAQAPEEMVATRQPALDALAELNGQLGLGFEEDILPAEEGSGS
mgnify:CR=1 FL=1